MKDLKTWALQRLRLDGSSKISKVYVSITSALGCCTASESDQQDPPCLCCIEPGGEHRSAVEQDQVARGYVSEHQQGSRAPSYCRITNSLGMSLLSFLLCRTQGAVGGLQHHRHQDPAEAGLTDHPRATGLSRMAWRPTLPMIACTHTISALADYAGHTNKDLGAPLMFPAGGGSDGGEDRS